MINAVVFDLDETIGYFTQLYTIWETIKRVCYTLDETMYQEIFNIILDIFEDYLRPFIMTIFKYLKNKKITNRNVVVMIYTNNSGPKEWTLMIKEYIHKKLNFELFDNIICAFKVDGKIVEPLRTTHRKTYSDLLRCTSIPKTTQIFFIDDQYHEKMTHENIYYIKIKPFRFHYSFPNIIAKLKEPKIIQFIKTKCMLDETAFIDKFIETYNKKYIDFLYNTDVINKPLFEQNIDISVGKQIMNNLNEFFANCIKKNNTRTVKKTKHNKKTHIKTKKK